MMTDPEYDAAQRAVLFMAFTAQPHDFAAMLERIAETNAVAPIIDPTKYNAGASNLAQIERLARAALEFRAVSFDVLDKLEVLGVKATAVIGDRT